MTSPTYQDLLTIIGDKEATIYAMRSRIAELERRVAEYAPPAPPADAEASEAG